MIWLLSVHGESPIDQALQAVGVQQDGGTGIEDYNRQQQNDEVFDDIIGCQPWQHCHGLPSP